MSPITVFLSSTCYDLGDLRAELAKHLERYAFQVRLSEDYESAFVASGRIDSIGSCLLNVEQSDVVVAVIDRRYGPPLPSPSEYAGVSATHAELLHARKKSKPVFVLVRDRTLVECENVLASSSSVPRWVDKDSSIEIAKLVKEQRDYARAASSNQSNWFDQFKNVVDLKPIVLKRLLDEFPEQVGAFARKPDRLVRLYFEWRGNNVSGPVGGTFRNAGNGPALNVRSGWNVHGADNDWHGQGGLMAGDEIGSHSNDSKRASYACPPNVNDLFLFCEYENTFGDKYRVEAPLVWRSSGYLVQGAERFKVLVGDKWFQIH